MGSNILLYLEGVRISYLKLFLVPLLLLLLFLEDYKILTLALLFVNGLLVFNARKQKVVFLMFCFFFLYSYSLVPYFWGGIDIAVYKEYNDIASFGRALEIHYLFLVFLYIFYNQNNSRTQYIEQQIKYSQNNFLFYLNFLVIIFLIFFSKSGENIFESGGYGSSKLEAVGGLSIYEYAPMLFLIGFVFSGRSKFKIKLLLFFLVIYILRTLLFGGRIEVIQTLLLVFLLFYEKKISIKTILVVLFIGYFINEIIGRIRGNPALLFSGDFSFIWNIFDYGDTDVIINNQGDVWYASARVLGLVHDGIISFEDRLYSFFNWSLSIFMPSRFVDKIASLAIYMSDTYPTGGGGLISVFSYAWLSYPGVLLIAIFFSNMLNKAYNCKNQFLLLYIIMILITYPRWFAYSPITMFKLCLYVIPLYFIYQTLLRVKIRKDISLMDKTL